MPASIAALPVSTSATAKASLNGKGDPVADDSASAGNAPFAALIQQLMGKQGSSGAGLDQLLLSADAVAQDPELTEAASDLDALLPFLEAMGLVQPTSPENALAASNPAISAVAAQPNDGALEQSLVTASEDSSAASPLSTLGMAAGAAAKTTEIARGQQFSEQLVAAIAASKEDPHAAGNTAAAVQQVIASTTTQSGQATAQAMTQPVGTAAWSEEIGNKIVWMANRMESKAELVLTPPQMGRVEVSLSISGEQATANFVSGNAAVREALEAALPRLREVLAEAGIQLGQAQVGAENARQSAQQEKNGDNFGFNSETSVDNAGLPAQSGSISAAAGLKTGRGLVDVFA